MRECSTCLHFRKPTDAELREADAIEARLYQDLANGHYYQLLQWSNLKSTKCAYDFKHIETKPTHVCHRWSDKENAHA